MKSNEQKLVEDFCENLKIKSDPQTRMFDLLSEMGELAKEMVKSTEYGKKAFQGNENWELEMGDLFFSLCSLANETQVNLSKALEKVIDKYLKRFEEKKSIDSGK